MFTKPGDDWAKRLQVNATYYKGNYSIIFFAFVLYSVRKYETLNLIPHLSQRGCQHATYSNTHTHTHKLSDFSNGLHIIANFVSSQLLHIFCPPHTLCPQTHTPHTPTHPHTDNRQPISSDVHPSAFRQLDVSPKCAVSYTQSELYAI